MDTFILYVGDNPTTVTVNALSRAKGHVKPAFPPKWTLVDDNVDGKRATPTTVSRDDQVTATRADLGGRGPDGSPLPHDTTVDTAREYDPSAKTVAAGHGAATTNDGILGLSVSTDGTAAILDPIAPGNVIVRIDADGTAAGKPDPTVKPSVHPAGHSARLAALPVATGAAWTAFRVEVRDKDAHTLHVDVGQPDVANRVELDRLHPKKPGEPAIDRPRAPVHPTPAEADALARRKTENLNLPEQSVRQPDEQIRHDPPVDTQARVPNIV
jgi:hypothetical protein